MLLYLLIAVSTVGVRLLDCDSASFCRCAIVGPVFSLSACVSGSYLYGGLFRVVNNERINRECGLFAYVLRNTFLPIMKRMEYVMRNISCIYIVDYFRCGYCVGGE